MKSEVTISCSADPVGDACFTLLFQLKQVNRGFIFAVPCSNLISLLFSHTDWCFLLVLTFLGVSAVLCQPE